MSAVRDRISRRTSVRREMSEWSLVLAAFAVIFVSLALPPLLRTVGMGPVTATSVCMLSIAMFIGHRASTHGLYPARIPKPSRRSGAILSAAVVLAGVCLWSMGAIFARLLVPDESNTALRESVEPYLLTAVFVLLIAPVTEEILYRGLLQGALNRVFPVAASVAVTTVVFAFVHPHTRDIVMACAIGLLAGSAREAFGTMTAPILVHIAMNTASMLVPSAVVSALAHGSAAVPVLVVLAVSLLLITFAARSTADTER